MPDLQCRIFYPQSYIKLKGTKEGARFSMPFDDITFCLKRDTSIHVKYDENTQFPDMHAFKNVIIGAQKLPLSGYLYDETMKIYLRLKNFF